MRILLIHQNFPGQFKHLAPKLAQLGHQVVALVPHPVKVAEWRGVKIASYKIERGNGKGVHPWLTDTETKVLRAQACYTSAAALRDAGFTPDVILAHHGWGESMFLKDVWPQARLGLYCELYYQSTDPFTAFDPEFPARAPKSDPMRLRLKNINNRLHEEIMDAGLSPTRFQAETFPNHYQDRISVIHDGIATDIVCPKPDAALELDGGATLTRADEVVTFINRNLEPHRGYHIFMRALPDLLRQRPDAQIVIIGGDQVSYGSKPPGDTTWKQISIDEVRDQISAQDWGRVHFLDRVPYQRYLSVIQVSRVHVYLTYPFVLSWSLLEAMSAGCAILASDTAPVAEVLEQDVTGRMFDFFDTDALVSGVCDLLDDSEARDSLGQAARREIQAKYDLHSTCLPKQLDWVNALANLPARPPRD